MPLDYSISGSKLVSKGGNKFSAVTVTAGSFETKIYSNFPNGIVKVSPVITINVECKSEECQAMEDEYAEEEVLGEQSDSQGASADKQPEKEVSLSE